MLVDGKSRVFRHETIAGGEEVDDDDDEERRDCNRNKGFNVNEDIFKNSWNLYELFVLCFLVKPFYLHKR